MYLSVIIPAYNEEKNLYKNVLIYNNYLCTQNYDYEIIIVNDGSNDDTKEEIEKLKKDVSVKGIDNKTNKGKGFSVREGLLEARGEYRLFIDADNATTIDHLDLVWGEFRKGCDVVIASRNPRDIKGASQVLAQSRWKRLLGTGGNILIRNFLVKDIWDTQCGFKIFKKEVVENIITKTKINRWAIDVEILALCQKNNYKINIIPANWKNSDYSRVGIKGYITSLVEIFKIKKNLILNNYN